MTRIDSQTSLPAVVNVEAVHYSIFSSVIKALQGQKAFVITMSASAELDQQLHLLDAAKEADVQWVLLNI
jgi:phosphoheptose isomerase